MRTFLRFTAVALAAAVGVARGVAANRNLYAPLRAATVGAAGAASHAHDPDKPTAVVVLGAKGAEVSDVLAPFEVLATTDAFNVYTVAPERRPLPLWSRTCRSPTSTHASARALRRMWWWSRFARRRRAEHRTGHRLAAPAGDRRRADGRRLQRRAGARLRRAARRARRDLALGADQRHGRTTTRTSTGCVVPATSTKGDVSTTGGLLSNIDRTLRVVEPLAGPAAARQTADAVDWRYYSPGAPASIPVLQLGPDAVRKPLNAAYRRTRVGVMLTDGVGELELASVFDTHSGQSFAARTIAVAASDDAVASRHGLTFVPTSDLHAVGDDLDRLIAPSLPARNSRGRMVLPPGIY